VSAVDSDGAHWRFSRNGGLVLGKSLTIAALAGVLAGGLAAVPAQARISGTAAHQHHGGSPTSAPSFLRSTPLPPTAQQAMLMARAHWLSEHAGVRERAALAAGLRGAGRAVRHPDGALTGIVRGLDGRPVAGACVTATGPSGTVLARSRANGRYILPGLRSASTPSTSALAPEQPLPPVPPHGRTSGRSSRQRLRLVPAR
jgi:hypothetical protein